MKRVFELIEPEFDISDARSWALVSRDFNQSVFKNQRLWYKALNKYYRKENEVFRPMVKNPNTDSFVGVDYYRLAKVTLNGKFKRVFQVEMIIPERLKHVEYPTDLYTRKDNRLTSKHFSFFDIESMGGLKRLIHRLDDVYIEQEHELDELNYFDYQSFGEMGIKHKDLALDFKKSIEVICNAFLFELQIVYPIDQIQPYFAGGSMKEWREDAFKPALHYDGIIVYQVYDNDYEDTYIPLYFTLRGDYAIEYPNYEMTVNGEYLPDLDMRRIVKIRPDEMRVIKIEINLRV